MGYLTVETGENNETLKLFRPGSLFRTGISTSYYGMRKRIPANLTATVGADDCNSTAVPRAATLVVAVVGAVVMLLRVILLDPGEEYKTKMLTHTSSANETNDDTNFFS